MSVSASASTAEMTNLGRYWARVCDVVEQHIKRGENVVPTVCAGIIWQAVKRARDRSQTIGSSSPSAAESVRLNTLSMEVFRLHHAFERMKGAGEMVRDLVEALNVTYNLAVEANRLTIENPGSRSLFQVWQEAKDVRAHQLTILTHSLDLFVKRDLYEPALEKGADKTTLANLGLWANDNVMHELGVGRGMPLVKMGLRARLRYAGAY